MIAFLGEGLLCAFYNVLTTNLSFLSLKLNTCKYRFQSLVEAPFRHYGYVMKMIDDKENRALTPLEILSEFESAGGTGVDICPEKSARIFFESWINNNMAILLIMTEYTKQKPRDKQIEKLLSFLDSIETHYAFPEQQMVFSKAIDFLRKYLYDYPLVDAPRSARAATMIRHLYLAMGLQVRENLNPGGRLA